MNQQELVLAGKHGQLFEEESGIIPEGRAREWFEKVKEDPDNSYYWHLYSYCMMYDQRMFVEAMAAVSTALTIAPLNPDYRFRKGWLYLKLNRFQEATAEFALWVSLQPNSWSAIYHLAMARFYTEDYSGAEALYERIYTCNDPTIDWPAVYHWHWLSLQMQGKPEQADATLYRRDLSDALEGEENPFGVKHKSPAYYMACLVYKNIISPEGMLCHAKTKGNSYYSAIGTYMAIYYDMMGDCEKAIELYKECIEIVDPDTPQVLTTVFARRRLRLLTGSKHFYNLEDDQDRKEDA